MDWFVQREIKLEEGEELLGFWRESRIVLFGRSLLPAIEAVAVVGLFFVAAPVGGIAVAAVFILAFIVLAHVAIVILQWYMRIFVLTNRRLIRREGILRVKRLQTQLPKVQSASCAMADLDKWLGLGRVTVDTASVGRPLVIQKVRKSPQIADLILETAKSAKSEMAHMDEPEIRQFLSHRLTTSM